MVTEPKEGLRERTRRAVRAELSDIALRLFRERGFDATTIDEITTAAGLSKRSFFRYFPTKEDVVFDRMRLVGDQVVAALTSRPDDEDPWDSLRAVMTDWSEAIREAGASADILDLVHSTPGLNAGWRLHRETIREKIALALASRPNGLEEFDADLLTGAAQAALEAAQRQHLRDQSTSLSQLVIAAFTRLRPAGINQRR